MRKRQPRQRANQKQQRQRRFVVLHESDGSSEKYELMASLEEAREALAHEPKLLKLYEVLHSGGSDTPPKSGA